MPELKNPRRERFCHLYLALGNATTAYIKAGYSKVGAKQASQNLLSSSEIQKRVSELQPKSTQILVEREISKRQGRIDFMQDRYDRMRRLIEARSKDPENLKVAGGDTGLVVVTNYQRKTYFGTDPKTGEAVRMTDLVPEFAVDTGLLREIRQLEHEAAEQMGQLVQKSEVNLTAEVSQTSLTLARVLTVEELKALHRKLEAAEEAKQLQAGTVKDAAAVAG